jgi:hypothetical protein
LAFSVGEELAVDDIGDAPLEATQRFLVGLGLGEGTAAWSGDI